MADDGAAPITATTVDGDPLYFRYGEEVACFNCKKNVTHAPRAACTDAACASAGVGGAPVALCVDCLGSGVDCAPHRASHGYRVADCLSHVGGFALWDARWSAEEELRLVEAIAMFGFGNWRKVAEHVSGVAAATASGASGKAPRSCFEHYFLHYLRAPRTAPLPDTRAPRPVAVSHSAGAGDARAAALATLPVFPGPASAAETSIAIAALQKEAEKRAREEGERGDDGDDGGDGDGGDAGDGAGGGEDGPAPAKRARGDDGAAAAPVNAAASPAPGSSGYAADGAPLVGGAAGVAKSVGAEIAGYMPLRGDFDVEHDNDAELLIADMEFRDTDEPLERALKLKVLEIYNAKLDERARRKRFVVERGLLDYRRVAAREARRPREDRDVAALLRPFARFHSQESHEALIAAIVAERGLRRRIRQLQEYRTAGCRTLEDAQAYDAARAANSRSTEAAGARNGSSGVVSTASRAARRLSRLKKAGAVDDAPVLQPYSLEGASGVEALTAAERRLCESLRLLPRHYLALKARIVDEAARCGVLRRDATTDALRARASTQGTTPEAAAAVFDFVVSAGWVEADPWEAPPDAASSAAAQ